MFPFSEWISSLVLSIIAYEIFAYDNLNGTVSSNRVMQIVWLPVELNN